MPFRERWRGPALRMLLRVVTNPEPALRPVDVRLVDEMTLPAHYEFPGGIRQRGFFVDVADPASGWQYRYTGPDELMFTAETLASEEGEEGEISGTPFDPDGRIQFEIIVPYVPGARVEVWSDFLNRAVSLPQDVPFGGPLIIEEQRGALVSKPNGDDR